METIKATGDEHRRETQGQGVTNRDREERRVMQSNTENNDRMTETNNASLKLRCCLNVVQLFRHVEICKNWDTISYKTGRFPLRISTLNYATMCKKYG